MLWCMRLCILSVSVPAHNTHTHDRQNKTTTTTTTTLSERTTPKKTNRELKTRILKDTAIFGGACTVLAGVNGPCDGKEFFWGGWGVDDTPVCVYIERPMMI